MVSSAPHKIHCQHLMHVSNASIPPVRTSSQPLHALHRLPAEYKQLEARVDALRDVHLKLLKITKVHETESVSLSWSFAVHNRSHGIPQGDIYTCDILISDLYHLPPSENRPLLARDLILRVNSRGCLLPPQHSSHPRY